MNAAAIRRIETVPDTMHELDADLSHRAAVSLGYGMMSADLQKADAKRELYRLLLNAGVKPFNEADVQRYKNRVSLRQWLKPLTLQIVYLGVAWPALQWIVWTWPMPTLFAGSLALCLLASFVFGSGVTWVRFSPASFEWDSTSLSGYPRPVPPHIVSLALSVADALKCADHVVERAIQRDRFMVEEFREGRRVADPFLIVRHQGAHAYIAVWDEPNFQSK